MAVVGVEWGAAAAARLLAGLQALNCAILIGRSVLLNCWFQSINNGNMRWRDRLAHFLLDRFHMLDAADAALQQQLRELKILHAAASACVQSDDEDELIRTVTGIIGEALKPTNYGVLLVDEQKRQLCRHASYQDTTLMMPSSIPLGMGLSSLAALQGRALRLDDVSCESAYFQIDPETRSEMCIPLRGTGRVIGVVNIEGRRFSQFSEDDERLLTNLADQMGAAIERLRAEGRARQRIRELQIISHISQDITSQLDQQAVVNSIVRSAAEILGAGASGLYLVGEDGRLYLAAAHGVGEEFRRVSNQEGLAIGSGTAVGQAVHSAKPVQFDDLYSHHGYATPHLARLENIHAVLAAPLLRGKQALGGIVIWHRHPYRFSLEEETFMQALANQCINAIENARLYEAEREQRQLAEVLRDTGSVLSANLDRDSLLDAMLVQVERLIPYDAANFMIIEDGVGRVARLRGYDKFGPAFVKALQGRKMPVRNLVNLQRIVETRQPFVISDTSHDPNWIQLDDRHPIKSWLGAPVVVHEKVVGLFSLDSATPNFFQPSHAQRLDALAGQASLALQNVLMFEEIQVQAAKRRLSFLAAQEQAGRMALLARLSEHLNYPRRVDEVILAIGQGAMELCQVNRGAVFVRGMQANSPVCAWYSGVSEDYISQVVDSFQEMPGRVWLDQDAPVIIGDIMELETGSALRRLNEVEGVRGVALWPLVYQGQVTAAVGVYQEQPAEWSSGLKEVMEAFTRQAAVALQNAHLFEETHRRAAQQETLNRLIVAAASAWAVDELIQTVLDLAMDILDVQMGGIWVGTRGLLRGFSEQAHLYTAHDLAQTHLRTPRTLLVTDWEKELLNQELEPYRAMMLEAGVCASLAAPLICSENQKGQLLFAAATPRQWNSDEVILAETIGRQVGSALERLELLERLQDQARQMQSILDTVPEGVLVLAADGDILLANPAALDWLPNLVEDFDPGQTLTQLAHRPIENLWDDVDRLSWREIYVPAPEAMTFEVARRALNVGQASERWVLVLRDVTQERSNLARVQMQDRLATVGQLAAGIAHDFNNIMAAVVVYADLLAMQADLSSAGREYVRIIQQQVQRASALIRQILDFSRRSVLEPSPLDLLPFLKEFEKLLGRILPENIRLKFAFRGESFMVKADPVRLQQAFMNLVLNARDAMPEGGRITISLGHLHLSEDDTRPLPEVGVGHWILIEINDTGCGIEPEILPHVFDPFFTTKPVGKGTGLGLSQVYGIINRHGGAIDVSSTWGMGSRFMLYLPALEPEPSEYAGAPAKVAMTRLEGMALLVEDDQAARQALQTLLENQGLQVTAAGNGMEALACFDALEGRLDLVISDIIMPEMGGVALFRALQQRQPGLKFLFITGHPLDDQGNLPIREGQVQLLLKPFLVQELIDTVSRMLTGASGQSGA